MTFSEAIKLGAMQKSQTFGQEKAVRRKWLFFGPKIESSCAIQAAIDAAGCVTIPYDKPRDGNDGFRPGRTTGVVKMPDEWLSVIHRSEPCPVCNAVAPLHRIVAHHLNDKHRWTRTRIAEWVATIEQKVEEGKRQIHQPQAISAE